MALYPRTMHSGSANHSTPTGNAKIRNYYIITLLHVINVCPTFILVCFHTFILSYFHTSHTHEFMGQKNEFMGQNNECVGQFYFGC